MFSHRALGSSGIPLTGRHPFAEILSLFVVFCDCFCKGVHFNNIVSDDVKKELIIVIILQGLYCIVRLVLNYFRRK